MGSEEGDREKMLKAGVPTEQQQHMGKPAELPTQSQSLVRRFLLFPLTRLLIAVLVFAIVVMVVANIAVFVAGFVVGLLSSVDSSVSFIPSLSTNASQVMELVLVFALFAVAGIITLAFMGKVIERRSLAEVGLGRGLLRNTLQGFGIGLGMVLLLGLMLTVAVLVGLIPDSEVTPSIDYLEQVREFGGVFGYLGLVFAITCLVAVAEEIVFRGLLFRMLEEGLGSWLAMAISAVLFGMAHLGNFEDPTLLSIASQTAGGFGFAAAYMLTRNLWLPIGIHWGWNFVIFAISSPEDVLTLSDGSAEASPALTDLIASMPDVVLAIVLLALVIRRGQIRTPRWMQRKHRSHNKLHDVNQRTAALREEKAVDEMSALK